MQLRPHPGLRRRRSGLRCPPITTSAIEAQSLTVGNNNRVEVRFGAFFEVRAADAMASPGGLGSGFLRNEPGGTVCKTGPNTSTIVGPQGVAFVNDGLVEVAGGVLQLGNGAVVAGGTGQR